jgi:hypothetical protein
MHRITLLYIIVSLMLWWQGSSIALGGEPIQKYPPINVVPGFGGSGILDLDPVPAKAITTYDLDHMEELNALAKNPDHLVGQGCGKINGHSVPCDARWPNADYPYYEQPDGCSTPIAEFKRVPHADISPACNKHDRCYMTLGYNKFNCDSDLSHDIRTSCDSILTDRKPWEYVLVGALIQEQSTCYILAPVFHAAVLGRGWQPYHQAQEKAAAFEEYAKQFVNGRGPYYQAQAREFGLALVAKCDRALSKHVNTLKPVLDRLAALLVKAKDIPDVVRITEEEDGAINLVRLSRGYAPVSFKPNFPFLEEDRTEASSLVEQLYELGLPRFSESLYQKVAHYSWLETVRTNLSTYREKEHVAYAEARKRITRVLEYKKAIERFYDVPPMPTRLGRLDILQGCRTMCDPTPDFDSMQDPVTRFEKDRQILRMDLSNTR